MIASQGNLGQEWFGSLKVATQSTLATERKIQIKKRHPKNTKGRNRNENKQECIGSLKVH